MANPLFETVRPPFTAFNFAVEISVPDISNQLCTAAFAECDGLEMSMEIKTIREGGNNGEQHRLVGPISYGQLTLKRGMTANFDLWHWFNAVLRQPTNQKLRPDATVIVYAPDGTKNAEFTLKRCLPLKLKAPPLNAKDGLIGIEEFQMAYQSLNLKDSDTGLGLSISAGISIG
jgi:phage tail-like protein